MRAGGGDVGAGGDALRAAHEPSRLRTEASSLSLLPSAGSGSGGDAVRGGAGALLLVDGIMSAIQRRSSGSDGGCCLWWRGG